MDTIEYKKYEIEIIQDDDGESPRDCDNLGKMVCWHRRMNLGDENPKNMNPIEFMTHELIYNFESEIPYPEDSYCEDWLMEDDKRVYEYFYKFHVVVPIHAYEHGGITISSGRFSDPFDSGQLGFIYISKEDAMEEFSAKRWSMKLEKKILSLLDGEIKTYDQYLTGDVWGIKITSPDGEEIENCWGFYGYKYAEEEAKRIVDWNVKNTSK